MSSAKIIKSGGEKLDKFEEVVSQVSFVTYSHIASIECPRIYSRL